MKIDRLKIILFAAILAVTSILITLDTHAAYRSTASYDDESSGSARGSMGESWYFVSSLGSGLVPTPGRSETINSRYLATADLLGFYNPIWDQAVLGGVTLSGTFQNTRFNDNPEGLLYEQQIVAQAGPSFMAFLSQRAGQGLFVRTDFGPTMLWIKDRTGSQGSPTLGIGGNTSSISTSSIGYGVLAGLGFGVPVSAGTRFLFSLNYAQRTAIANNERLTHKHLGLSLGMMF